MTEQRSGQQWIIKVNGAEQMDIKPGESLEIGRKPLRPLADDGHRRFEIVDEGRSMSKRHALLTVHDDGTADIRDLNSTNGSYMIRENGELTRLQAEVDFQLPYSPIRLQFGDVPVDFIRVEAQEHTEPEVTDLFAYARDGAKQEPDPADMSVDDILNLRAGEPTAMFSSQNVADRLRQLRDASLQVPRLAGTEPAVDEPQPAGEGSQPDQQAQPSDTHTRTPAEPQDTVPVTQHTTTQPAGAQPTQPATPMQPVVQQAASAQPTQTVGPAQPTATVEPAVEMRPQPFAAAVLPDAVVTATQQRQFAQEHPIQELPLVVQPGTPVETGPRDLFADAEEHSKELEQLREQQLKREQEAELQRQERAQREETERQEQLRARNAQPVQSAADAQPVQPEQSVQPAQPVQPTQPAQAAEPAQSPQPVLPVQHPAPSADSEPSDASAEPVTPVKPSEPAHRDDSVVSVHDLFGAMTGSGRTAQPAQPEQPAPQSNPAIVQPDQLPKGQDYSRFARPVSSDPAAATQTAAAGSTPSVQASDAQQSLQSQQSAQPQQTPFKPVFEPGSVFDRVSRGDFDHKEPQIEVGGFTAAQAKTTTDYTDQFQIARHAQLLPFLAMNPTLYDDLYAWLAAQGNADVDAALAHNQGYQEYRKAVGK